MSDGSTPLTFLSQDDVDASPVSALAAAFISASGGMSEEGVKAFLFLQMYSPTVFRKVSGSNADLLALKVRQTPGTIKRLMEAIQALSFKELWDRVNLMPGGK